jgi:hypothetical protein
LKTSINREFLKKIKKKSGCKLGKYSCSIQIDSQIPTLKMKSFILFALGAFSHFAIAADTAGDVMVLTDDNFKSTGK